MVKFEVIKGNFGVEGKGKQLFRFRFWLSFYVGFGDVAFLLRVI